MQIARVQHTVPKGIRRRCGQGAARVTDVLDIPEARTIEIAGPPDVIAFVPRIAVTGEVVDACQPEQLPPDPLYGDGWRADENALTSEIVALASQYGRYGYRRITALLRSAGWAVNAKRVERIWRRD